MRPRVVVVQRRLAPFRRDFFRALAQANPQWGLEVFHGGALGGGEAAPLEGVCMRRFRTFERERRHGFDLAVQPGVAWELLRRPPDLVVLEGSFGIVSNALVAAVRGWMRRPTLFWVCGWEKPGLRGRRQRLKRAVARWLLARADGAIAYGSAARAGLLAQGVRPERVVVAQNAIDVESIAARAPEWRERGHALRGRLLPDAKRVVVYVGRVIPEKRLDLLLEAHAELRAEWRDLGLLVVGDGPGLAALREGARARGIEGVHFAGAVREGVEAWFAAGDVFAMPGTGGLALNQAMALGLPLVVAEADGTERDLVAPRENGLRARPGDARDLARCLRRVLEDPAAARRMGARSAERVLECASLGQMVASFSDALRAALSGSREARQG